MTRWVHLVLFASFGLLAGPGYADIYNFTIDHCSSACGTNIGTVTVTQDGTNTVKIEVAALGTGFEFVNSTSHGDDFLFDIIGSPTISVSSVTAGWELVSTTAGSLPSHGGGGWRFEYAMTCDFMGGACNGGGASHPGAPSLDFDVTASGLTPASFRLAGSGTTADFGADVISLATGNTGLIGATLTSTSPGPSPASPVPEPASIVLLATLFVGTTTALRKRAQKLS